MGIRPRRIGLAPLIGIAALLIAVDWGCSDDPLHSPETRTTVDMALDPAMTKGKENTGPSLVPGTGTYDVAVILIQPPGSSWVVNGSPIDPCPYVNNIMFDASDNYAVADAYAEMSYGQLLMSGDVYGPIVITKPSLNISHGCQRDDWEAEALDLADDPPYDYDFSSYDLFVYVYPPEVMPVCRAVCDCNGQVVGATEVDVYNVWDPTVYAHELGHLFGLGHAHSIDLNAATNDGTLKEYGDYSCFMGNSWIFPPGWSVPLVHVNGPHKVQAGWIPSSHILNINTTGIHTGLQISPLEIDPASCSHDGIIRITHPQTGQNYYLSYRYPASSTYDGNPDVRYAYQTFLTVDFFESVNIHSGYTSITKFEAAPGDNGTWSSPDGKVIVTQTDHDEYSVTVDVTLIWTDVSPSLSIVPLIHYGIPATGLDVSHPYTLTITNTNPQPHTYAFAQTSPAFFDAIVPADVTVPANSSTNVSVLLEFFQAGQQGNYSFTISVSDVGNPALSNSVHPTYSIDTVAPSTPTGLAASSYGPVTLTWNASTDITSGVAFYRVYRNGVLKGTSATTTYVDNTTQNCTSYTYTVRAVDAAGNASAASSPLSFVTGGCGNGGCRGCPPPNQG